MEHGHLVRIDPEPVGDDLRPRRVVPLAMRRGPRLQDDLARRQTLDRGSVPTPGRIAQRPEDVRRRQPAHLDIGGHADPELTNVAGVPPRRLLLAELLVADQLERLVEEGLEVAGVDRQPADERRRLQERRVEVDPADLGRVLPHLPGERVHRALDHVGRLGTTRPAIRVGRRRVRQDAAELVPVGLRVIGAHVDPPAELGDPRGQQLVVRAHIRELDELHPDQLALLVGGEGDVVEHAATVGRRDVVLAPFLDPLHGTPQTLRQCERERLLGVHVELRAEPAADVGSDHAQVLLRADHA